MPTRSSSSSSSSSSDTEEITTGVLGINKASKNIQQTGSNYRAESSTASQASAIATGTPYDTISIATTNTGFTNVTNATANTSISQQQIAGGGIPIIRPPVLQSQEQLSGTNIGGINQPIQIDVASAHQQYQQHTVQSEISPYSGSSETSSGGSLSSPGSASLQQQQQPRFDVAKAIFQQADANRDGSISQEEFRQWAQGGNQTSGQFQYQQAQFANQLPGQQPFNQLLGADAFNDVVLNIDYGVIEAYNIGIQSASDITAEQFSKGFDAAKAIFKQADTNQDGAISRDEFRQWAQGNQQNIGGQSYPNYQATATNYSNNFQQAQSYGNTNPELASILQQSGLAQGYANYR